MAECSRDEAVPLSQEGNQGSISARAADPTEVLGGAQRCTGKINWCAVGPCYET